MYCPPASLPAPHQSQRGAWPRLPPHTHSQAGAPALAQRALRGHGEMGALARPGRRAAGRRLLTPDPWPQTLCHPVPPELATRGLGEDSSLPPPDAQNSRPHPVGTSTYCVPGPHRPELPAVINRLCKRRARETGTQVRLRGPCPLPASMRKSRRLWAQMDSNRSPGVSQL